MPGLRTNIPADLERSLFVEAGFRCAVPNCGATQSLQIDHIEEWAKVREHRFENMIVLCANCHSSKSSNANPRKLDKKALLKIKSNLILLNYRYSDLEKRILEAFHENRWQAQNHGKVYLPWHFEILVKYLVKDGLCELNRLRPSMASSRSDGSVFSNAEISLTLTETGITFVQDVFGAA